MSNAAIPLPDASEYANIYAKSPLYSPIYSYQIQLHTRERPHVFDFEDFAGPIDAHCVKCGRLSVFHRQRGANSADQSGPPYLDSHVSSGGGISVATFCCSRDATHIMGTAFLFEVERRTKEEVLRNISGSVSREHSYLHGTITKIGQYPSLATLQSGEIEQYRRILGREYTELSKAVGLFAHGVGIGSFVYLRRIFENLVEEAHQTAKALPDWDDDQYFKSRMDEKIGLLKDLLPTFLVEKRVLYAILSKGIHELTEAECLEYFPAVRLGIELILDAKLEEMEKQRKIAEAGKALADIHSRLV